MDVHVETVGKPNVIYIEETVLPSCEHDDCGVMPCSTLAFKQVTQPLEISDVDVTDPVNQQAFARRVSGLSDEQLARVVHHCTLFINPDLNGWAFVVFRPFALQQVA